MTWTLNDNGEFVLDETYSEKLKEAKRVSGAAWQEALFDYLAENSTYTQGYLHEKFYAYGQKDEKPQEIVDAFILQALEGDL